MKRITAPCSAEPSRATVKLFTMSLADIAGVIWANARVQLLDTSSERDVDAKEVPEAERRSKVTLTEVVLEGGVVNL